MLLDHENTILTYWVKDNVKYDFQFFLYCYRCHQAAISKSPHLTSFRYDVNYSIMTSIPVVSGLICLEFLFSFILIIIGGCTQYRQ